MPTVFYYLGPTCFVTEVAARIPILALSNSSDQPLSFCWRPERGKQLITEVTILDIEWMTEISCLKKWSGIAYEIDSHQLGGHSVQNWIRTENPKNVKFLYNSSRFRHHSSWWDIKYTIEIIEYIQIRLIHMNTKSMIGKVQFYWWKFSRSGPE